MTQFAHKPSAFTSQLNSHVQVEANAPQLCHPQPLKAATQQERVMIAMLYHGSINAQEAERRPIHARHLNSVVSTFANDYRLQINRTPERVFGYARSPLMLHRYQLLESEREQAQQLVDSWRKRRGAAAIHWPMLRTNPLESYFGAESGVKAAEGY